MLSKAEKVVQRKTIAYLRASTLSHQSNLNDSQVRKHPRKSGNTIFTIYYVMFRPKWAANSVVCSPIWQQFKLIQYVRHLFFICKFKKDKINSNPEKEVTLIFIPSIAAIATYRIWQKFKLIQACMHALITCKNEEVPIENKGARVATIFFPF